MYGYLFDVPQDFHSKEEDDDVEQFPLQQLTALIGEKHAVLFPSLVQLVVADSAYLELNNKPDQDIGECEDELLLLHEQPTHNQGFIQRGRDKVPQKCDNSIRHVML